jgi:hypothetical protein
MSQPTRAELLQRITYNPDILHLPIDLSEAARDPMACLHGLGVG